ncbi:hypothetical protein EDD36DRAFT_480 [Exophiala viscosa]|uniref:CENP-V/GFA domain-containing protein n=1 Tax=Exophiala viscosa TaxID=2486360 RepID=A0AAN6E5V6_9EURO|nr:hypothetical protein EDD36DRAFT_480 [Exophiala viscosa]
MSEQITGSCNCGRHVYTIPKPTQMNLCRLWSSWIVPGSPANQCYQIVLIAANGLVPCEQYLLHSHRHGIALNEYSSRHSAHLFVESKDITTSSPQPRTYTQNADSGNPMERAWCDECGCGIWIKSHQMPDQTFLKAGKPKSSLVHPATAPKICPCVSF